MSDYDRYKFQIRTCSYCKRKSDTFLRGPVIPEGANDPVKIVICSQCVTDINKRLVERYGKRAAVDAEPTDENTSSIWETVGWDSDP